MSVRVMSAVFESRILGPVERLVMLALADHADDAGRCYPSNARLQDRTGLSERAVRANIRKLEDAGFLAIAMNAGQGGANVYIVRPDGAPNAPRHEMPPGTPRPTPRHMVPVGGAPYAPKPSRTINTSVSKDTSVKRVKPFAFECPTGVDPVDWQALIANRKQKRAALTEGAYRQIINKLERWSNDGWPPGPIVANAAERGWTTIFETDEMKGKNNGSRKTTQDGRGIGRTEAATRDVIARLGRTASYDREIQAGTDATRIGSSNTGPMSNAVRPYRPNTR